MGRSFRKLLTNPVSLIFPVVAILLIGWQHYTHVGLALSISAPSHNLIPDGNFESIGNNGLPEGWTADKSGDLEIQTGNSKGYVGGNSLDLAVTRYSSGAATITSSKISLAARQTYLYKGYYESSARFELLARYFYKDGTSELKFIKAYPGDAGTWSTVSDAFDSSGDVAGVQFIYKIAAKGKLAINGVYLETKQNIYIEPARNSGQNMIPNSELTASDNIDSPDSWSTYSSGNNVSSFSYGNDGSGANLRISLSNYIDGEAKWQYQPQSVKEHQFYNFSVSYMSDAPAHLVVEYETQNGGRQFNELATLTPTNDWTTINHSFEVPPGAVNAFVSVILQNDGNLQTRKYSLTNDTKPGAASWSRPLVSITLDDGWQSAYVTAFPLLNRYGYKATFYINPSSIETPNFMTASELNDLSKAGEEIGAHGYAHDDMTAINTEELNYQLQTGRDYLREAGFYVNNFATPYGNGDAEVQWYARQYYQTLRGTESGINTRQSMDPFNLKVIYVDNTTQLQTIEEALKSTKLYNGWMILVYHGVGQKNPPIKSLKVENDTIATDNFIKQINLVKDSNITVLPVGAAYTETRH